MGTTMSSSNPRGDNLNFPPEITEIIMKHLSPRDKLIGRQVCQDWNDYLSTSGLDEEFVVKFRYSEEGFQTLGQNAPISPATVQWTNFYFSNINLTRNSNQLWTNYGEYITTLHFDDCSVIPRNSEPEVDEFRMGCPNLKHLALTNCDKYFMMGGGFFHLPKLLNLENLESLDLSNNSFLNDSILFSMLLEVNSLRSINLSNTPIAFMPAIFGRFYPGVHTPQSELKNFSDNILTFQMLNLSFLSTARGSQMNELIFSRNRLNRACLGQISNPEQYRWNSLILNACYELNSASLVTFLRSQQFITKLEMVGMMTRNSELRVMTFPRLKHIRLSCPELMDFEFLKNVPDLEHLDITNSTLDYVPGALLRAPKLKVLTLRRVRLAQVFQDQIPILVGMREDIVRLKCLTELDLGNCASIVDNGLVQAILQHLTKLRRLKLCNSIVTDEGLVGPRVPSYDLPAPQPTLIGFCLSQLEHLRVLGLANCLDLDERTWMYALRLPNLITLDLSRCSQISNAGLHSISQHCRNLEHLNLMLCNVRDAQTISNLRSMPRLRQLIILGQVVGQEGNPNGWPF